MASLFFEATEEHWVTEDGHPVAPESLALTTHQVLECECLKKKPGCAPGDFNGFRTSESMCAARNQKVD